MATQENRSMVSEVSICNQALSFVGANRISSLDEANDEGEWCLDNYPFIRDAVLEDADWTFASDYSTSTVSDTNSWGMYTHNIPIDWLRVIRVFIDVSPYDPSDWVPSIGWRRSGRFVLANDSVVYLYGTKRIVDTGYFSSMFIQALAARLAAEMAIPFTGDKSRREKYWDIYQEMLTSAASSDGQQGRSERIRAKRFITAR